MVSTRIGALLGAVALALSAQAASAQDWGAAAELHNQDGLPVGEVSIRDTANGALLYARLSDLPPGAHAFHIHEVGECEPPFDSAGGHYNPEGVGHGFDDPDGMHAGDMPNVHVPDSGKLEIEVLNHQVTVDQLLGEEDGTSIVIHEGADDYVSDPAGDAGPRIACGVIEAR